MKKKLLLCSCTTFAAIIIIMNISIVQRTQSDVNNVRTIFGIPKAGAYVNPAKNNKALYSNGTVWCCKTLENNNCTATDC